MKNTLIKAIVSLLGVGFIRPLSATWGSLAAGIILYFFWPELDLGLKLGLIVLVLIIGTLLTDIIEKKEKLHDPHFVVIDEAVGMMITTLFLTQVWWHWLIAFILFRVFDILKPWPASFFDKQTGGISAMMDDVMASGYSLAVVEVILRLV